jgi:hypothetical protein
MNFKLVSKNNIGIIATLILVIILSQSRFFSFLINTALGRLVLIFFILVISCINKILGVVVVLFIIIIFNKSNIDYLEGFTATSSINSNITPDKLKEEQLKLNNQNLDNTPSTTPSTSVATSQPAKGPETFKGREGFNTVDRESTMLRGKRSNEVPILSNARNQSEDIEPTDNSVFVNAYSSF